MFEEAETSWQQNRWALCFMLVCANPPVGTQMAGLTGSSHYGGGNIKEWPRLFSFCLICRETSGGEEGHVCGETGHSGDQKPAGEDQQHPRPLRRRREYRRDAGLSPVRSAVMWLFSVSAVRPPEPRLCGTHPVWDEPAGKNMHAHTRAHAGAQLYPCIVFQTTDENWNACILNEAAKVIYKVINQSADQTLLL